MKKNVGGVLVKYHEKQKEKKMTSGKIGSNGIEKNVLDLVISTAVMLQDGKTLRHISKDNLDNIARLLKIATAEVEYYSNIREEQRAGGQKHHRTR